MPTLGEVKSKHLNIKSCDSLFDCDTCTNIKISVASFQNTSTESKTKKGHRVNIIVASSEISLVGLRVLSAHPVFVITGDVAEVVEL